VILAVAPLLTIVVMVVAIACARWSERRRAGRFVSREDDLARGRV